jgi:transposase-like protein
MPSRKPTQTTKPLLTMHQVERMFATEDACKALLTKLRWPDGTVACPRCNATEKVYKTSQAFRWKCKACNPNGYRFSVLTGSVFENTNMPLRTWFRVAFLMLSSKKGMSALQVWRMMPPVRGEKGSYKTFWYMCHRIRAAMQDGTLQKLTGEVEVDETYVGGEAKNRHGGQLPSWKRRLRAQPARPKVPGTKSSKVPVVGAISRTGNVVAKVLDRVTAKELHAFVEETVSSTVSLIATDDHLGYRRLKQMGYPHQSVKHQQGEYVRGRAHTATIDGFWGLLKRSIMGSFHHVSAEYLQLYVDELTWRFNRRHDEEIFYSLLAAC